MKWRLPSKEVFMVLAFAQGWGQVKLVLTLLVAHTTLSPAWQWVIGSVIAVGITWVCYRSTNWAAKRWGKD